MVNIMHFLQFTYNMSMKYKLDIDLKIDVL